MLVLQSSCRSASEMKVFLLTLVCTLVGAVTSGSVAWPGAVPVAFSAYSSAILPAQTRSIAYSSSQYINALPSSPTFGYQPQFTYQLPQSSAFPSIAYQPASAPYFPQSGFFYPQIPQVAPIAAAIPATPAFPAIPAIPASPALPALPIPQQPSEFPSSQPTQQPAGDEDSAVVDSAEFPQQQQSTQQTPATGAPSQPENLSQSQISGQSDISSQSQISGQSDISSQSQFPSQADFPSLQQIPLQSGFPSQYHPLFIQQSQPSLVGTQEGENMPSQSQQPAFPQFPQFPQLPQIPQLPQFPSFPNNPLFPQTTTPSPSVPANDSDSKGLNDEDSVSVDSA